MKKMYNYEFTVSYDTNVFDDEDNIVDVVGNVEMHVVRSRWLFALKIKALLLWLKLRHALPYNAVIEDIKLNRCDYDDEVIEIQ